MGQDNIYIADFHRNSWTVPVAVIIEKQIIVFGNSPRPILYIK